MVISVLGGTIDRAAADGLSRACRCSASSPTPPSRSGGICSATPRRPSVDAGLEREVLALLERLGRVVTLPEDLLGAATSVSAVGPAYMALVAEAQVDAAVRHGLKPELAGVLAAETMAGTAELLARRDYDTLAVRREVTSPRGSTARGLDALERAGLRSAFSEAMNRVRRATNDPRDRLRPGRRGQLRQRGVRGLHRPHLHLHPAQPAVLVRDAGARTPRWTDADPELPARRLGALPALLSPLHPAVGRLRSLADDRHHRALHPAQRSSSTRSHG